MLLVIKFGFYRLLHLLAASVRWYALCKCSIDFICNMLHPCTLLAFACACMFGDIQNLHVTQPRPCLPVPEEGNMRGYYPCCLRLQRQQQHGGRHPLAGHQKRQPLQQQCKGDRVAAAGSDVKYVVRWLGAPPVVVRAFAAYAHQHTVYDFTKYTQHAELTRTSQAIPPNLISTTTHQGSVIQLLLVNLLITCSKMVGRMGRARNCELRSTRKLTGPCRYGYHQGD